jgi:hypothetical protein
MWPMSVSMRPIRSGADELCLFELRIMQTLLSAHTIPAKLKAIRPLT